jgi:RHS repeat-associated protein
MSTTTMQQIITQSFNALSQRTQIARYQSTGTTNAVATTDFTFDTANRLSGVAHKQGSTNLNTYAYAYDPLSRIATIVSTLEGTDTYSYDQTSQLVVATHTSQANETYGFDANGNRNTSGFTTGTNNQTTAGLGFTFVYDDEGNRTSKTETSTGKVEEYTWDHRNRLTKVVFRNTSGGAIVKQVDYEYDAYNRLVRRTFDADGAGAGAATNQYWVYDEGINAVLQFDGSSASNLSHRYLWSDNVDELLANEQLTGSNTLWGLADHLGSLRDIADYSESTGVTTIANHRTINSFGKLISETNAAVDMLFAFTGKQFDEATGLQHNLFRWLDPSLGQWLNEDPLSFAAGDENVRRYVWNAATVSVDSLGLQESTWNGFWTQVSMHVDVAIAFQMGAAQGLLNGANVVTDTLIETANVISPMRRINGYIDTAETLGLTGTGSLPRLPELTAVHWSRDMVVPMDDMSHNISRGGFEVALIAGTAVLPVGRTAPSLGANQAGLLTRTRRFFYDNRNFRREISPEYWATRGGANGHSLHHWLIPQRAGIPQGIQNAGFNLINLPPMRGVFHRSLDVNTWMGWARNWGPQHAARAARVENGIRIGIPLLGTGTAYVGYEVGGELWDILNGGEGR